MANVAHVTNNDGSVKHLFELWGWRITEDWEKADVVCFSGGADISPSIYNHPTHKSVWGNSPRDRVEVDLYNKCREVDKPIAGICRGLQLLNAMEGGYLYQNITGHFRTHPVKVKSSPMFEVEVSSIHHQMVEPNWEREDLLILLEADEQIERTSWNGEEWVTEMGGSEIEGLFYGDSKCMGVQGHPEYMPDGHEFQKLWFNFIKEYLL